MMALKLSGFENGKILLDEPNAVYYSGQLISGKVEFELYSTLRFLCVNVTYTGEANVKWTEKEAVVVNNSTNYRDVQYVGREVYFDFTQQLSGQNGVAEFPIGVHSIPFSYQLPFTVPSSFKGDKGNITYKIIAFLLHRDGTTREEIVKEIEVVAPLDLNTDEIKKPLKLEFDNVYSCNCSCVSRPLTVSIQAPHSGFSPGQVIPFTVDAKNATNVEVKKIKFEISRKMRFVSQRPMSTVIPPAEIVVKMEKGPILSKTDREYKFNMQLPDFIALNFDNCAIIDVGYFLKVTLEVSGCNDDLTDEAEICMGLVPIGSNLAVRVTHPMADLLPESPVPIQSEALMNTQPPPYDSHGVPNYQNNLQVCPPGPMPYPTVMNVNQTVVGCKNNASGTFESHQYVAQITTSRYPNSYPEQNVPYPYVSQNQNVPYSNALQITNGSYPNVSQNPSVPYPIMPVNPIVPHPYMPQNQGPNPNQGQIGFQMPNLPQSQSYQPQNDSSPSAPPM